MVFGAVVVAVAGGVAEEAGADSLDCVDGGASDLFATFVFSRPCNSDASSFKIEKNR
jgi:hypothetical protein